MSAFHYIAIDPAGKKQKGILEADTARQVRQQLRQQNLTPLEVHEISQQKKIKKNYSKKSSPLLQKRVKNIDLSLFTRQLATLLTAGIALDDALAGVAEQTEKPHIQSILLGVRSRVLEGHSLAAGMDEFPRAFPKIYRITIASGERSGKLDLVLTKLAEFTERQHQIRQKVRQAMIYPTMMTIVSILVVVFLLIYVVPKIVNVFTQTHQVLPFSTIILIAISTFLIHYGIYLIIILAFMIYGFLSLLKRESFRRRFHHVLLRLPVIGKAIRIVNAARFGRTFGILNAASVPILESMSTAGQLITPLPMREAVQKSIERVREGASIHLALQQTHYFSPMFIHLIASGEMSGQLDNMLEKASMHLENEVTALIETGLTLFEPLLILIMGAIVLFIVLAIMLPIFALDQFGGQSF